MAIEKFTRKDQDKLTTLSKQLFGNNSFVVFSDDEMKTDEYKEYSKLLDKKLSWYKFLSTANVVIVP